MKKQALKLQDLKVTSFVTHKGQQVKGGSVLTDHSCPESEPQTCDENCGGGNTTLPCTQVGFE